MTQQNQPYRGRFAPSPTGPLHLGSLFTAVASWLDARVNDGTWLIRMEDLDPPREMAGAKELIYQALDAYGLVSDEPVVQQSDRDDYYQRALDELVAKQAVFYCDCSRKTLAGFERYPGFCYQHTAARNVDCAVKFKVAPDAQVEFDDQFQGKQLWSGLDDFVLYRKDKLWAYQLAVVVDDHLQGISHVVRGIDLIDSTPRHALLRQALGYSDIHYGHLPVISANNGQKLSKQNHAAPISLTNPMPELIKVLNWLGIDEVDDTNPQCALDSAINKWQASLLQHQQAIYTE